MKFFWTIRLVLASVMIVSVANAADVHWISSTDKEPWRQMPGPSLALPTPEAAPQILVRPTRTYQTVDGFGGSFNELGWVALGKASAADQRQVMTALFGDDGTAFTLARIPIGASDFALDAYSLADTPEDYGLDHFSIERDRKHLLPYVKAVMEVRPALQAWASPWSPPGWMKTNNSYSKGSLRWEPKILDAYANYFARWIESYRAEGVNLYAISPQNEPNILNVYPTTLWSASQLSEFIGDYLGPTLKNQGIDIEIWLGLNGDPFNGGENPNDRLIRVMEDAEASEFITGIGFQYDSRNQIALAHELYPDRKLMQSESVCFNGDNSWEQAEELYRLIKRYFDGGANAYFAWNMILDETGKSSWDWAQNALITVDQRSGKVTYNGEYYVYKQFSRFVKPGAKRIMTTGSWGDRIAFENQDGSIVLVVANISDDGHEVRIAVEGLSVGDTLEVELAAHSINTFVVVP